MTELHTPLTAEKLKELRAGDRVLLSGTIYTARDAAHKRMTEQLARGEALPFELQDATIYFVGPTPTKPGERFGSGGPTTSGRMDRYSPTLLDLGLRAMIGKGKRDDAVKAAIRRNGAVYFGAIGGAAAVIAACVKHCEVIAYPDLGPEAVRRLEVENMELTVILDPAGGDLYEAGRAAYLASAGAE